MPIDRAALIKELQLTCDEWMLMECGAQFDPPQFGVTTVTVQFEELANRIIAILQKE